MACFGTVSVFYNIITKFTPSENNSKIIIKPININKFIPRPILYYC